MQYIQEAVKKLEGNYARILNNAGAFEITSPKEAYVTIVRDLAVLRQYITEVSGVV